MKLPNLVIFTWLMILSVISLSESKTSIRDEYKSAQDAYQQWLTVAYTEEWKRTRVDIDARVMNHAHSNIDEIVHGHKHHFVSGKVYWPEK